MFIKIKKFIFKKRNLKMSDDKNKKIQEIQILEQTLQNIFFQKQAFQMELTETQSALREIENSDEDAYKLIGQLMVKVQKSKITEELSEKEKFLNLKIKALEKQEKTFSEKLEQLRKQILNK